MRDDTSNVAVRDYGVALHMNVSAMRQPVKTRTVGLLTHACPHIAITLPLRAAGHNRLPASLLTAHDGLHLHPAVVAAAAHATCELLARKAGIAVPGGDEGLFERLPRGQRALGAAHSRWTEMALHRLEWMTRYMREVTGGNFVHGLVRWVSSPGESAGIPGRDPIAQSLMQHLVLAFSSPPIVTPRRAPSLEYYRASGVMVLRGFGPFTPPAAERR